MDLPSIDGEQLLSLVFLLMALVVAIGALRGHRRYAAWQKGQEEESHKRKKRSEFGGPWGG